MKEKRNLKQLIPWIEKACNENLFPGLLGWIDKEEKIFFVTWIHKSSDGWEKSKSAVFEAWAINKQKLVGKDDRDLKAAFRCALQSKKNIKKIASKSRNQRMWQITRDSTESATSSGKVKRTKQKKTNKIIANCSNESTSTSIVSIQSTSSVCSTSSYNNVMPNEIPLPPYQSLFHVSPPTPPKQQTDVCLETLASKEEFFHLQEHIMNVAQPSNRCDIYRVPSPITLPISPTTSTSFFDVFSEVDKNSAQTTNSAESFSNSHFDFLLQNTFETINEQIVPNSPMEWNLNGNNQIINFDQSQYVKGTEIQQISNLTTNEQLLEADLYAFSDLYTW